MTQQIKEGRGTRMGHFLFINLKVLPILLAIFSVISLARRQFEAKQLLANAVITLVIWWIFAFSLIMIIFIGCMPFC